MPELQTDKHLTGGCICSTRQQTLRIVYLLLIVTCCLTGLGLTGSSLGLADQFHGIHTGVRHIWGDPSAYRSDEWGVITPAAMAQVTHNPPFPIINTHFGVDGGNMLLVHMTGAPVFHVASLVKPPVWLFFFLDMPRALAWYWWAPLFMGLTGVFVLLQTIWRGQTTINVAATILFVFSMHATAFSYWPGYVASFCCFLASAFLTLLRVKKLWVRCLCALGMGWSFCGALMTLYIPWVIPLLFLNMATVAGVIVKERLYQKIGLRTLWQPALVFGAFTACILIPWFYDSKDALFSIAASVYPGGRLSTGGDWPLWGLVKGWVALTTFYTEGALMYSGQGYNLYPSLLLPLLVVFVHLSWRQGQLDAVPFAILLFMIFVMIYQYVGIPILLAKATLWARTHGFAAEIGMGLGQAFCLAAMCNRWTNDASSVAVSFAWRKAAFAALCWTLLMLGLMFFVPHIGTWSYGIRCILAAFILFLLTFLTLSGRFRVVTLLYAGLTLSVTLWFNPLSFASTGISLDAPLSSSSPLRAGGRSVYLGASALEADVIRAAGVKILSGCLFYADQSLQVRFYSHTATPEKFHKYNLFLVDVGTLPEPATFQAEAGPDSNRLTLDGHRFDFNDLLVDFVIIPSKSVGRVLANPSLGKAKEQNGLTVFQVLAQ